MRFWVDIANAPQATFFRPVLDELQRRGHRTVITFWDRGQARALVLDTWPDATSVGTGFRRPLVEKATAIWQRSRALAECVRSLEPDVALSHNSYSQILAARRLDLPIVTTMDYEHQPANHLAFRLADCVLLPEAIPYEAVKRYGLTPQRALRYKGIKENITLANYRPDPGFRASLGVDDGRPVVSLRLPPDGALYHRSANPLIEPVLEWLCETDAHILISPRTRSQAALFARRPRVAVLETAVHGADLLFHSDIFVGAGGTMTREAAVLGTPTFSMFSGRQPAVDRELISAGRLRMLTRPSDLAPALRSTDRSIAEPNGRQFCIAFVDRLLARSTTLLDSRRSSRPRHGGLRANIDGRRAASREDRLD